MAHINQIRTTVEDIYNLDRELMREISTNNLTEYFTSIKKLSEFLTIIDKERKELGSDDIESHQKIFIDVCKVEQQLVDEIEKISKTNTNNTESLKAIFIEAQQKIKPALEEIGKLIGIQEETARRNADVPFSKIDNLLKTWVQQYDSNSNHERLQYEHQFRELLLRALADMRSKNMNSFFNENSCNNLKLFATFDIERNSLKHNESRYVYLKLKVPGAGNDFILFGTCIRFSESAPHKLTASITELDANGNRNDGTGIIYDTLGICGQETLREFKKYLHTVGIDKEMIFEGSFKSI